MARSSIVTVAANERDDKGALGAGGRGPAARIWRGLAAAWRVALDRFQRVLAKRRRVKAARESARAADQGEFRSLIVNGAAIIVFLFFVVIVIREVPRNTVLIDPIQAPSQLVADGFTPQVISQRLMEEMLAIREQASSRKEGREVTPEWQQPDIEVPGTGVSIRSVFRITKGFFGFRETRVGGEIVRDGEQYRIRLRIYGQGATADPLPGSDLDELLHQGARRLLDATDPYILAASLADDEPAAALRAIAQCLAREPASDDPWAYNLWGFILVKQGRIEAAFEKYQAASEAKPDFALAFSNWGLALAKLGDHEAAIAKYRRALEVDPRFRSAYNNWGIALTALGRHDAAIDKYRQAVQVDPKYSRAFYNWGSAHQALKQYDAAIEKFELAVQYDPGYGRA